MIKGKSKFDYEFFYGDDGSWIGISKQVYSREEAIAIWEEETDKKFDENSRSVQDRFARYRFGLNEDDEPVSGWFLEGEDHGNKSVPVWAINW